MRRKNVTEGACIYTNAWALVTEIKKNWRNQRKSHEISIEMVFLYKNSSFIELKRVEVILEQPVSDALSFFFCMTQIFRSPGLAIYEHWRDAPVGSYVPVRRQEWWIMFSKILEKTLITVEIGISFNSFRKLASSA